jgi:hypothetical protein
MNREDFDNIPFIHIIEFVLLFGDFINATIYYGQKVVLYAVEGFYVELYYSMDEEDITHISILEDHNRLHHYSAGVDLSDVL